MKKILPFLLLFFSFFTFVNMVSANVYNASGVINNDMVTTGRAGLNYPEDKPTVDSVNHRLFVADASNNRVLIYNLDENNNLIDSLADYVLGQPDFDTVDAGLAQNKFDYPSGLAYDSDSNRLFISDYNNNRVMIFSMTDISNDMNASHVLGQGAFDTNTLSGGSSGLNHGYHGLAYDKVNKRLFVGDTENYRVMIFDLKDGISNGMNASYVLGQPNFDTVESGLAENKFLNPIGISHDGVNNRLFVVDNLNKRVMVFNLKDGISNGMNASYVIGQSDLITSTFTSLAQNKMEFPENVDYDEVNERLFVNDYNNSRVLVFNVNPLTIENGMNAINIVGQPDGVDVFTSTNSGASMSLMGSTEGLFYDSENNRLYVTDTGNNRIMIFDLIKNITNTVPNGTVDTVYNQSIETKGFQGAVTYEVLGGTLPPGISLIDNKLEGTPTTAGSYTFTIRVNDNWTSGGFPEPFTDKKTYTMVIEEKVIAETPKPTIRSSGSSASSRYINLISMGNTQAAEEIKKEFPNQINPIINPPSLIEPAIVYDFGPVTLKKGSKGEAVKELQRFLNKVLNLGLVVDGKLGPKTVIIIKQWQKVNDLTPDGLVGKKTKEKMNASIK